MIVVVRRPCQENYLADAHPSAHKSVLESANPAWTRSVHLDAPGQQHGQQPVSGTADPGVVKQNKSSRGSVDTTKTRLSPQRVRMSIGERPIGAAKGKQSATEALCQPPPPPFPAQTFPSPTPNLLPAPFHRPSAAVHDLVPQRAIPTLHLFSHVARPPAGATVPEVGRCDHIALGVDRCVLPGPPLERAARASVAALRVVEAVAPRLGRGGPRLKCQTAPEKRVARSLVGGTGVRRIQAASGPTFDSAPLCVLINTHISGMGSGLLALFNSKALVWGVRAHIRCMRWWRSWGLFSRTLLPPTRGPPSLAQQGGGGGAVRSRGELGRGRGALVLERVASSNGQDGLC